MKTLKFREIITILRDNGFEEDRVKGSHAQYVGVIGGQRRLVTVQTNHLSDTVDPGTFKSIIRNSGLPKSAFERR
ncbi:MAG: type II toxin-antitoxin system HicA family toxin [Rhodospirillales bacterium]|nr:type II toxin-antitoxin system HicA family toxin [Rhodospirillales bacterium]MBN8905296.1 type II toxin-antitoxin system HicA family toxin [Rhodospirillales bacterium]MBN8925531.1 type II toxin-antitoxin system HicA family toxin [Rhodospirillales bacterium]